MPRDPLECGDLRGLLTETYGVIDEPQTWLFVCGQLTSAPASSVHIRLGALVNGIARLRMNKLAKDQFKEPAMNELKAKLGAAMKKAAEEAPDDESDETELTPPNGQPYQAPPEAHPQLGQEEG